MKPMPVTYTMKHHNDGRPCEREVVIPAGWEQVRTLDLSKTDGVLAARGGEWRPVGPASFGGDIFIRPKPPATTLEVGGHYELGDGGIHKCYGACGSSGERFAINERLYDERGRPLNSTTPDVTRRVVPGACFEKPTPISGPGWYRTRGGSWIKVPASHCTLLAEVKDHGYQLDLIAKATPEQARVLEGL